MKAGNAPYFCMHICVPASATSRTITVVYKPRPHKIRLAGEKLPAPFASFLHENAPKSSMPVGESWQCFILLHAHLSFASLHPQNSFMSVWFIRYMFGTHHQNNTPCQLATFSLKLVRVSSVTRHEQAAVEKAERPKSKWLKPQMSKRALSAHLWI